MAKKHWLDMSVARNFVIPGLGTFTNRLVLLNIFDRTNLIRPANGIGVVQAAYGPRITVYDALTVQLPERCSPADARPCPVSSPKNRPQIGRFGRRHREVRGFKCQPVRRLWHSSDHSQGTFMALTNEVAGSGYSPHMAVGNFGFRPLVLFIKGRLV